MTTKRITWTDVNGTVRVTTPAKQAMDALVGSGGMLDPTKIDQQAAAYVDAGMGTASARRMAEGYANGGLTEAEALDLIRERSIPGSALNTIVIEATELPYFGSFGRAAWHQNGASTPVFDMVRARPIKTEQIRKERDRRLEETDIEVLQRDGGPIPAPLVARRQALRDMPATVQTDLDAVTTPEALEAYEPAWPV